ncbi:MAG: RdgB/HAM1 family non-canonical purine NTP pyrophosphatase [Ignavibacteriae bacterium]|nr:RdgB/HAM1 family non-canonical purine NTP pyrophosphatase [Ignavibacteriota bacterium]
MKIIFATGNKGKLKEVKNIFNNTKWEIISLSDLGFNEEIEETGKTFEENAYIKADTIFEKYNIPVIADDSGLLVEQLDNKPGVYSARFAGPNASYDDNNKKLLYDLENFNQPHKAKFVCNAVFVSNQNRFSVEGELKGEITNTYKGSNGFGYDPLFKPENYSVTLAEMTLDEKNKISHRAIAFNKLKQKMLELTSQQ